jgi:CubicO group peptidase (beta-lactamase class C family)
MKKYCFIYIFLTTLFIGISYKIKDDYFYIPYPNAIEFVLAFTLLLFTFIIALWKTNRKLKIVFGIFSIIVLMFVVNLMTYYFEWHPLIHSLPFTKSQSFEVNFEPAQWTIAKPSSVGLNEHNLNQYLNEIKAWERLRGLVVIKDDKLVVEKYQGGATKYSALNVHSVTKSITSALIGLAIQKGNIKSENELVTQFFPEYREKLGRNNPKSEIKIVDLLTMQGGFTGNDGTENVEEVFLKRKVIKGNIGKHFNYYTGSNMVLSAIITKTSKISTKEFAEKNLFEPLGMHNAFWRKVDGYYCGGDQTYFTPRDLAKFGNLYLKKGNINGVQLLDSMWIEKSFMNHALPPKNVKTPDCYQEIGYGFSWWLLKFNNEMIYTARGMGGQYVMIIPKQNIVVVIVQAWKFNKNLKSENEFLCKLLSLIIRK